ncbi:hypothetical protein [Parafrankia sp. FMc2]|uniref:hypothetical protein n=1 Tax=Parafrankia sp. FMc2 TaxID=3233196 RepID=UPI0034D70BA1
MSAEAATAAAASGGRGGDGTGSSAVRGVSVIMVLVMGLSFLFGFGNSWALGLHLGVPPYVAPLVAPAVDLSVVGLLLGIRQLALGGATTRQMRPAWRLLVFAGFVTLALNIAEPLIEQNYGRAAFDAVGPLLLIGWAEVGPGLLQAMKAIESKTAQPTPVDGLPATNEASTHSDAPKATSPAPARPQTKQSDADPTPVRHSQAVTSSAASSAASMPDGLAAGPEPGTPEDSSPTAGAGEGKSDRRQIDKKAREQNLLHRARAEDVLRWQHHQRPISADTLRKRLHVGAPTARRLVAQLRSDTHTQIEGIGDRATDVG